MAEVIVLGAGMVGVSAALELQKRGYEVTLLDRRGSGEETSFGNAGVIQAEAAEPYAFPRDLATQLRYLAGATNDIVYDISALSQMAPALWAYFRNSERNRHARISSYYAQLTSRAKCDHACLIDESGAGDIVQRRGYFQIHRSVESLDVMAAEALRLKREYGVAFSVLDGQQLAQAENSLKKTLAGAVHWTESWTCSDPGRLTSAYARLLTSRGGRLVLGDATSLKQTTSAWTVDTEVGRIAAPSVVVALGPWSPDLLRRFGYVIPMIYKRGYHGHYATHARLSRPLVDVANGIVLSPMSAGLRVATGAALVSRTAPADPRQLLRGAERVSDILDIGPRIDEPQWLGHRPCLPDMLPLVGLAPKHKGMWFNFGHGHQGFTLGPTTAKLLADLMAGRNDWLSRALSPADRINNSFIFTRDASPIIHKYSNQ